MTACGLGYATSQSDPRDQTVADRVVNRIGYAYKNTQHFLPKIRSIPIFRKKHLIGSEGLSSRGKSLIWLVKLNAGVRYWIFERPGRDGYGLIGRSAMKIFAPWYSIVERFVGISGNYDGLDTLPDGDIFASMGIELLEKKSKKRIKVALILPWRNCGRCAAFGTTPKKFIWSKVEVNVMGTQPNCYRGCPFGGYSVVIQVLCLWAAKTGKSHAKDQDICGAFDYFMRWKKEKLLEFG